MPLKRMTEIKDGYNGRDLARDNIRDLFEDVKHEAPRAAVRKALRRPRPMSANRPASRKAAWLTKIASAAVTMATMKHAQDALWQTVRADTSLERSGRNRSFNREVGLGVES